MKENKVLSVILLSYYSSRKIRTVYEKMRSLFAEEKIPFEFIIMDDGSRDDSFILAQELERDYENVKAFQLSRNFSSNYSAFAGLSVCAGGCATLVPDDEQQPYSSIVEMYRLWEKGCQVVIPYRISRDDAYFSVLFSRLYYKLINTFSNLTFPVGGADTFLIDEELINILNVHIHPINTAIVPEVLRLGFSPYYLPYERPKGTNKKSRWSFRKKVRLALDTFFSSSAFPIKAISFIGLFTSIFSFVLILFYVYIKLFSAGKLGGYYPPGWLSIILIIAFFSGMILLSLGVIAEYVWRIYEEVKGRPGFIIKKR